MGKKKKNDEHGKRDRHQMKSERVRERDGVKACMWRAGIKRPIRRRRSADNYNNKNKTIEIKGEQSRNKNNEAKQRVHMDNNQPEAKMEIQSANAHTNTRIGLEYGI